MRLLQPFILFLRKPLTGTIFARFCRFFSPFSVNFQLLSVSPENNDRPAFDSSFQSVPSTLRPLCLERGVRRDRSWIRNFDSDNDGSSSDDGESETNAERRYNSHFYRRYADNDDDDASTTVATTPAKSSTIFRYVQSGSTTPPTSDVLSPMPGSSVEQFRKTEGEDYGSYDDDPMVLLRSLFVYDEDEIRNPEEVAFEDYVNHSHREERRAGGGGEQTNLWSWSLDDHRDDDDVACWCGTDAPFHEGWPVDDEDGSESHKFS